jgi:hypothetical protein
MAIGATLPTDWRPVHRAIVQIIWKTENPVDSISEITMIRPMNDHHEKSYEITIKSQSNKPWIPSRFL